MATITLRAYLEELNYLLEQEALEEVIGHCRHILQYFPKNLEAYRLLGKALLEKGRFDEALQIFPLLLSADPADYVAHLGLSTIYENKNDYKRALWHMERAFEQIPNHPAIAEEIRRLYQMMGKNPPDKIKLTRGALAKQYADSRMYDQAISQIRQALAEQPQRIDLKILLAKSLWEANYPVEAGETALDILQVLPDSLVANMLMAKLWIASKRPEDAQPFLKRVEDLAPYESLALVYQANNRNTEVPDSAFNLNRLDWSAATVSSFAAESPDWVKKISDVFNLSDFPVADTPADEGASASPFELGADAPDWVKSNTGSLAGKTPAADVPDWFGTEFTEKPKTGKLSAPEDWFSEMSSQVSQTGSLTPPAPAESAPKSGTGFTGLLNNIAATNPTSFDSFETTPPSIPDDELASLRAAARPSPEDMAAFFATDTPGSTPPADDMSWMSTGNGDSLDINDEFTPDWFNQGSGTSAASQAPADEMDFATMFGGSDQGDELPNLDFGSSGKAEEPDMDFATMFGGSDQGDELPNLDFGSSDQAEEPNMDFATMFGGSDQGDELPNLDFGSSDQAEEPDMDFATMFGGSDQGNELPSFDFGANSQEETGEDEEFAAMFGDESPEINTSWLASNIAPETPLEEDDLASMFGEPEAEPTDVDLDSILSHEAPVLNTSWFNAQALPEDEPAIEDDDFDSLFKDEPIADTNWLSQASQPQAQAEPEPEDDFGGLFGEEPLPDTSWLAQSFSEPQAGAEPEPEAESEFNFDNFDLGSTEAEPELDFGNFDFGDEGIPPQSEPAFDFGAFEVEPSAQAEPQAQLEAESDFDLDLGEFDFDDIDVKRVAESAGEGMLSPTGLDDDLGSLFDEETPLLNTTWLSSNATPEDEAAEADFAALFSEEAKADTSWLGQAFAQQETPPPVTSELRFLGETQEEPSTEETDFAGLFSEEPVADTSWLGQSFAQPDAESGDFASFEAEFGLEGEDTRVVPAYDEESPEAEEDLGALFGEETPAINTSWLSASMLPQDESVAAEEEVDLSALFSEERVADTSWLGQAFAQSEESEGEPAPSEEEADLSALFNEEPVADTSWLGQSFAQPTGGMEIEDETTDMFADADLGELFGEEAPAPYTAWLSDNVVVRSEEPLVGAMSQEESESDFLGDLTSDLVNEPEGDWLGGHKLTTEEVVVGDTLFAQLAQEPDAVASTDEDEISETDLAEMFGVENAFATSDSLTEQEEELTVDSGFYRAVDVAESIASQPLAGTDELPDWLMGASDESATADMEEESLEESYNPQGIRSFDTSFLQSSFVSPEEPAAEEDDFATLFDNQDVQSDTGFLVMTEAPTSTEPVFDFDLPDLEEAELATEEEMASDFGSLFAEESVGDTMLLGEEEDESAGEFASLFETVEETPAQPASEIDMLFADIHEYEQELIESEPEFDDLFAEPELASASAQEDEYGIDALFATPEPAQSEEDDFADADLFAAMTRGEDPSKLIKDAEYVTQMDWVSDFEADEEPQFTTAASFAKSDEDLEPDFDFDFEEEKPSSIPENVSFADKIEALVHKFIFDREPRWMRMASTTNVMASSAKSTDFALDDEDIDSMFADEEDDNDLDLDFDSLLDLDEEFRDDDLDK